MQEDKDSWWICLSGSFSVRGQVLQMVSAMTAGFGRRTHLVMVRNFLQVKMVAEIKMQVALDERQAWHYFSAELPEEHRKWRSQQFLD